MFFSSFGRFGTLFASQEGAVAEVVVNAMPYLVGVGQGVPGTAWQVEAIAVDRVVLSRRGGAVDAQAARRVFALPALPTLSTLSTLR